MRICSFSSDTGGKRNPLPLRPHHGLCLAYFIGKGYSDSFSAHMEETLRLLMTDISVRLTVSADEICRACPHNGAGICVSASKVAAYDEAVLAACGLTEGNTMKFLDFARLIQRGIVANGRRAEICGGCMWSHICDRGRSRWDRL